MHGVKTGVTLPEDHDKRRLVLAAEAATSFSPEFFEERLRRDAYPTTLFDELFHKFGRKSAKQDVTRGKTSSAGQQP